MKAETRRKIASCKALQDIKIGEFIRGERFLSNLGAYLKAQQEDREKTRASFAAMYKVGTPRGYKIPAHPVDLFLGWTALRFAEEYGRVLDKTSNLSARYREYVRQLGNQAFNLTVAQIAVEEFSELEDELLPKPKDGKNR